jgi:hypothetical protein
MRSRASLVIFLILAGCGGWQPCAPSTPNRQRPRDIAMHEVAQRVMAHDQSLTVFDANPPELFVQHHIPGAQWIAYDNVTAEAPAEGPKGGACLLLC